MNLFFRELKSYWVGLVFWCLGIIALIWSGMVKFSTLASTGQSVNQLFAQFPKSLQTIFGLDGFNLNKESGYFGVLFMYIALMVATHAVLLGAGIIAKEERDRTSEFLFVKPIPRAKAVTIKITAGILMLIVVNLVTLFSSIYFVDSFGKGVAPIGYIFVLMTGLFFIQILFFFIGTTIAALKRNPKNAVSVASGVLLFTFILTYFINLNNNFDFLKYLTPFKYFDARDIIASNSLDVVYVTISLVLVFVMIIVTRKVYAKRDLSI